MQTSLIDQGFNLMLYGMGTVFVFLTILVFATGFMSRIVSRFETAESAVRNPLENTNAEDSAAPAPHILKAIELAISQHRQR